MRITPLEPAPRGSRDHSGARRPGCDDRRHGDRRDATDRREGRDRRYLSIAAQTEPDRRDGFDRRRTFTERRGADGADNAAPRRRRPIERELVREVPRQRLGTRFDISA